MPAHTHKYSVPKCCCGCLQAVHCTLLSQSITLVASWSFGRVYPQGELLLLVPPSPESLLSVFYLIPLGTADAEGLCWTKPWYKGVVRGLRSPYDQHSSSPLPPLASNLQHARWIFIDTSYSSTEAKSQVHVSDIINHLSLTIT